MCIRDSTAADLLARAAFGLPELFPDDLARAARARTNGEPALVACAGCYPTATSLAAAPAIRAGLAAPGGTVVVDAISGVTGAGKKLSLIHIWCHRSPMDSLILPKRIQPARVELLAVLRPEIHVLAIVSIRKS